MPPKILGVLAAGLSFVTMIAGAQTAPGVTVSEVITYTGSADASGAVAAGVDHFIVGDDEDPMLRIYPRRAGGAAAQAFDLNAWDALSVPGAKKAELDLEAAARLGENVFWMGSHGNSKEGKIAPSRRQLFATTLKEANGRFEVVLVGKPYRHLVEDLAAAPSLREFNLAEAAQKGRAPKDKDGFNLEGLAATPDGHLLLGFRNPIPNGRALLVPLLNPEKMMAGTRAQIGAPILLDLGKRGVRDIAWTGRDYLILAGDYRGAESSKRVTQLYRWDGAGSTPQWLADFPDLNPEALIVYPDSAGHEVQILSDDGQKPPLPLPRRTFRSVWVRW